jgi:DNA-binding beta-propeller fold protein YncE
LAPCRCATTLALPFAKSDPTPVATYPVQRPSFDPRRHVPVLNIHRRRRRPNQRRVGGVGLTVALAAGACGSHAAVKPLPLREVGDIHLPGRTTRFDYADVDSARHVLVVAHLGDDTVVAVDLASRRVAWTASNLASAHGVRLDPKRGRVFVSATGTNEVVALDEETGREVGRAHTGAFPDGVAVDDGTNRLFVSNKNGGTVSVFRADNLQPISTIAVGGDIGNVQTDGGTGQAFVTDGHDNRLLTIDTAGLSILATDNLNGCSGAHGVAIDTSARRAYVACEDNATLVVEDLAEHREITRLSVGDSPDVLAVDNTSRRLYVAAESGTVTVVSLDGTPAVLGRAHLADGAHTVAVDPELHLVAFALANVDGGPVLRLESPT